MNDNLDRMIDWDNLLLNISMYFRFLCCHFLLVYRPLLFEFY